MAAPPLGKVLSQKPRERRELTGRRGEDKRSLNRRRAALSLVSFMPATVDPALVVSARKEAWRAEEDLSWLRNRDPAGRRRLLAPAQLGKPRIQAVGRGDPAPLQRREHRSDLRVLLRPAQGSDDRGRAAPGSRGSS